MRCRTGAEPVVSFEDVSFAYEQTPVLSDVTLEVAPRDFVAIIGPNGGGKTTLAKLILGLIKPTAGVVQLFGTAPRNARACVGYVPQFAEYDRQFPITVRDVVLMGRPPRAIGFYSRQDRRAAAEALDRVGLSGFERRSFAELSGGQRQRVMIARALAAGPQLLVLDEPMASVDRGAEEQLQALLKELNREMTVLLITHDIAVVYETVNRILCVNKTVAIHESVAVTEHMLQHLYSGGVRLVDHAHDHSQAHDHSRTHSHVHTHHHGAHS